MKEQSAGSRSKLEKYRTKHPPRVANACACEQCEHWRYNGRDNEKSESVAGTALTYGIAYRTHVQQIRMNETLMHIAHSLPFCTAQCMALTRNLRETHTLQNERVAGEKTAKCEIFHSHSCWFLCNRFVFSFRCNNKNNKQKSAKAQRVR